MLDLLTDWLEEFWKETLFVLGVVGVIVLIIKFAIAEQKQWDEFSVKHHCTLVKTSQASVGGAIGTDGNYHTITIPGTNTFKCDDGIEYTRTK